MKNSNGVNLKSVQVLYEDDNALVINKPAGLVVHSDGRTAEPTVVDWVLANRPEIKGIGEMNELGIRNYELGIKEEKYEHNYFFNHNSEFKIHDSTAALRPGIVHRLDRETSGVLLIAKTQKAFWHFKKQFQKNEIRKIYHAFVYGRVKHDEGMIDRPIARSRANSVLWSATRGRRGMERNAITLYRVLHRFAAPPVSGGATGGTSPFSFLELLPRTGRTHQIRVHLKAINYPIVCDKLYAPPRLLFGKSRRGGAPKRECALAFTRLALHAFSIQFALLSGKEIKVEAPYPQDFKKAIKMISHM